MLLAWLTFRFVEQPVQNAYRAGRTRWLPARLAAGLALVAVAGLSVRVWSHELPPRFPSSVQALVDFEYDYAAAYRERTVLSDAGPAAERVRARMCRCRRCQRPRRSWCCGAIRTPRISIRACAELQHEVRFRLAQFTGSACPPLLAFDLPAQPFCRDVNDSVVARIAGLRPQVVLLAARWDVYGYSHLADTVAALRRASRARIVLLGQLPNWTERVPRLLFNEARRHHFAVVPHRLPFLDGNYDRADRVLREQATRLGVEFVSAYGILCNADGCLVRLDGGPGTLTTWDDHHLTSAGSTFVVRALAPRLR